MSDRDCCDPAARGGDDRQLRVIGAGPQQQPSPSPSPPAQHTSPSPLRFPLLVLGALGLICGLWAGLARLGVHPAPAGVSANHGAFMVGAFLGTLIAVERAVALGRPWMFIGPALSGAAGIAILAGAPTAVPGALLSVSSILLVAVYVHLYRRHAYLFTVTMGLGAAAWLGGNLVWMAGRPAYHATVWWMVFLLLTVAGERLELSRLLRHSRAALAWFVGCVMLTLVGAGLSVVSYPRGMVVTALGVIGLGVWLLLHDMARRTLSQGGLPQYVAIGMLAGYGWLVVTGVLAIAYRIMGAGPHYDAWIHAFALGFVFSMVFCHAPLIFPAVLRVPVRFHGGFYVPLVLLHITTAWRVVADVGLWTAMRAAGGVANVAVVILFIVIVAASRR